VPIKVVRLSGAERLLRMAGKQRDPQVTTDADLERVTVGDRRPLDGPVTLAEYDPAWPERYARLTRAIRRALGDAGRARRDVGSTSVAGLIVKPIVDIVLAVSDSANEAAYVAALEAEGYVLRIREPDWYEHRMLKGGAGDVNLHVFSAGCPEIDRMLLFCDLLRADPAGTRRSSAGWRHSAGATSRTTPTPRRQRTRSGAAPGDGAGLIDDSGGQSRRTGLLVHARARSLQRSAETR
jgi:GrpB-like predicted nucleotidyltransferase (UPF0157 family)